MACTGLWIAFWGEIAAFAVGDALAEGLSAGTLTPAVALAAIPEVAAIVATGVELYECYQEAGQQEDYQAMKSKVDAMQQELDQLRSASAH